MNRTQPAVAELLSIILRPWSYSCDDPRERAERIYDAAERVRQAQADDEYASWLEAPRCDAS